MTVVAVQVLISSSALSCELNQMFCIKIVIWQLTSKEEEESLSHAIKQQPRETGSLHSAITEDQPHVLVVATTVSQKCKEFLWNMLDWQPWHDEITQTGNTHIHAAAFLPAGLCSVRSRPFQIRTLLELWHNSRSEKQQVSHLLGEQEM